MEPLIWILLPGFTAVASGLLACFIMQSRMEVALALQRERLAETRGALDAEKSALGASLDTALRAAEELRQLRLTIMQLQRDLNRKEKALAEAAALLVLQKISGAVGGRGRMSSLP